MRSTRLPMSLAQYSIYNKNAKELARLKQDHFYLFHDLRNTVLRDKIKVVEHYKLHPRPDALSLAMEVLPMLPEHDRYQVVFDNIGMIKNIQDTMQLFRLMFNTANQEATATVRYDFAMCIIPILNDKADLNALLPHINSEYHESLIARFDAKEQKHQSATMRHH